MNRLSILATAALAAAATPAFAQDTTTGSSFTGPRAEIFGGWDRVGARTTFFNLDGSTTKAKDHANGAIAGIAVGYDMPIGDRLIVGAFGSVALPTAKFCTTDGTAGSGCLRAQREYEGGARVGMKVGPRMLVYAKGAYVNGRFESTLSDGTAYIKNYTNRDGWRAGAGAEFALNRHAYVKAEYDYTRYNSFDSSTLQGVDTRARFDRNQVLAGFGIRF
jgi:outer membrane immunogenic protein